MYTSHVRSTYVDLEVQILLHPSDKHHHHQHTVCVDIPLLLAQAKLGSSVLTTGVPHALLSTLRHAIQLVLFQHAFEVVPRQQGTPWACLDAANNNTNSTTTGKCTVHIVMMAAADRRLTQPMHH